MFYAHLHMEEWGGALYWSIFYSGRKAFNVYSNVPQQNILRRKERKLQALSL